MQPEIEKTIAHLILKSEQTHSRLDYLEQALDETIAWIKNIYPSCNACKEEE